MKKSTREFITKLLVRELEEEYYQDNMNYKEVGYIQDLIEASLDFTKGTLDTWLVVEAIEQLEEGKKEWDKYFEKINK